VSTRRSPLRRVVLGALALGLLAMSPVQQCRKAQILAAGRFGATLLRLAAAPCVLPPAKAPAGFETSAAMHAAEQLFWQDFCKGVALAADEGAAAPWPQEAAPIAVYIVEDRIGLVTDDLAWQAKPKDVFDRRMRRALFSAATKQLRTCFRACAQDVLHPDADKLAAKLAAARALCEERMEHAIALAAAHEVHLAGLSPAQLADAIEAAALEFTVMTEGPAFPLEQDEESLAGAAAAAPSSR